MIIVENEERQLSSEELQKLLDEVEREHKTVRTSTPKKKKNKIRFDMIIAALVAVAVLVGGIALVSSLIHKSQTKSVQTNSENPLEEEKYPEISDVVKNYMNAYLISDPVKRHQIIAQYVDNMGDIDETDIQYNNYYTAYSDIECYTKNGPYKNTYVVYAYYQATLNNIATTVPSIKTLYVIRDSKTGDVYIHNGISNDVHDYIVKVSKDEDVQNLIKEVNKEYKEALESDSSLKAFFDKMNQSKATTPATTKASAATKTPVTTKPAATKPAATIKK